MKKNSIEVRIVVSYKGKRDFDQQRSYWGLLWRQQCSVS